MSDHCGVVRLPETRLPTISLANQGLVLVEIATSSGAMLHEGSAEALSLSQLHHTVQLYRLGSVLRLRLDTGSGLLYYQE